MITKLLRSGALFALILAWAPHAPAQEGSTTSTNLTRIRLSPDVAEVVQMAQAKVPTADILAKIKLVPRMYNLTAQDVLNLDKLRIPSELVLAMIDHDAALARTGLGGPASPRPENAAPGSTSQTNAAGVSATAPPRVRQPIRRPEGVVVLPVPEPANRTNRPPEGKRRWTSSTLVEQAPPSPKLELVPDSPGKNHLWIKGYWSWRGGRWVWEDGYWVPRPGPDVVWIDGFWARHGRGWIWVPGHWR